MATITLSLRLPPVDGSPRPSAGGAWDPAAVAARGWHASLTLLRGVAEVLIIAVAFVPAGLAAAKDMRFPEKGEIAFVLHIPDAWDAIPDGENLILKSPDQTSAVSLSVVEDKAAAVMPYDDLAKAILIASNAKPFSKHEPGAIGDIKAEAYYSTTRRPTSF